MLLSSFIKKIQGAEHVSFNDTLQAIAENYLYQPTAFDNGLGSDKIVNAAGINEGSCRIFAFAQLQRFNQAQTLSLFGDYYWQDVLSNPSGSDHQNIRNFIKYGWDGVHFKGTVLTQK